MNNEDKTTEFRKNSTFKLAFHTELAQHAAHHAELHELLSVAAAKAALHSFTVPLLH